MTNFEERTQDAEVNSILFSAPFAHSMSAFKILAAILAGIQFQNMNYLNFSIMVGVYLFFNLVTTIIFRETSGQVRPTIDYVDSVSSFVSEIVILGFILITFLSTRNFVFSYLTLALLVAALAISYVNAKLTSLKLSSVFVHFENSTRLALLLFGTLFVHFQLTTIEVTLQVLLTLFLITLVSQLLYARFKLN